MLTLVERAPDHSAAHERLAIWYYYADQAALAWQHVHSAEALGHAMPPQFIALLKSRAPEP
jgi:hypothetical protein